MAGFLSRGAHSPRRFAQNAPRPGEHGLEQRIGILCLPLLVARRVHAATQQFRFVAGKHAQQFFFGPRIQAVPQVPHKLHGEKEPFVHAIRRARAGCLAGVWGHVMQKEGILEPGDLEAALRTAEAIGDDRLQKQSTGRVVPDSFTHGTAKQRYTWFKRGFDSGSPGMCDTFSAPAP